MLPESLRGVDIAALDTLRIVFQRGSFSAAADELGVRQSSVSYTINRLRAAFSDPLFVRQGNRISATERCIDIAETVERIIGQLEEAALPEAFDPSSSTAKVTISATYLSRSGLLPDLVRVVRQEAPMLSIDLIDGYADAGRQLIAGRADLALSPVEISESGVAGKFLFEDPYVCLMDPANDCARGALTPERFAAAPHVKIHYGQRWQPPIHGQLAALGHAINYAVSTPNPEDVRLILPGTDLIVAMPSRIAQQFASTLHIRPCPIPVTARLNMYWPARLNRSPLHVWLRDKIRRVAMAHA